jgi:hypothetical protein
MRTGFATIKFVLSAPEAPAPVTEPEQPGVHVPDDLTGAQASSPEPDLGIWGHINHFADNFIHKEGEMIGRPIAEAVNGALYNGASAIVHILPIVLTAAGMVCFVLTMAMGNGRPYKWGLMCYAGSAVGRVISHAF